MIDNIMLCSEKECCYSRLTAGLNLTFHPQKRQKHEQHSDRFTTFPVCQQLTDKKTERVPKVSMWNAKCYVDASDCRFQ